MEDLRYVLGTLQATIHLERGTIREALNQSKDSKQSPLAHLNKPVSDPRVVVWMRILCDVFQLEVGKLLKYEHQTEVHEVERQTANGDDWTKMTQPAQFRVFQGQHLVQGYGLEMSW